MRIKKNSNKGIETHPFYELPRVLVEKNINSKNLQHTRLDSLKFDNKFKNLIVPKNLVSRIINELEKIIFKNLSPDFLCYIFVYIYNRQKFKNITGEEYTDVEVSSRLMRDIKSNYNAHIQFLIKTNFIKLIKDYSTDVEKHHPRLYEINFDSLDNIELCVYKVNEVKIIALLEKKTINLKSIDNDKLKLNFDKNEEFLSKIKLDVTDDELRGQIEENYSSSGMPEGHFKNYLIAEEFLNVKAFNNNSPIHSYNIYSEKTGRIYDSFKNLKGNLKKFFKLSNESISDMDVRNSHPLFLMLFLTEELIKIVEVEKKKYNNKTSISNYEVKIVQIKINENISKDLVKLFKHINLNYKITSTYLTIELNLSNIKKQLISLTNICFEGGFYNKFIETKNCKNQDANKKELNKQKCKELYMYYENAELSNNNFITFSKRFKKKYPDLFQLFIFKRIESFIDNSSHKNFGFELCKIESEIRLEVIAKYVNRASKKYIFDMHDGFLIEENPKNILKINQAYKQAILKLFKNELDFLFNKQKKKLKIELKQKS
jgi:hypothetical protein